jgi:hypothetical protein
MIRHKPTGTYSTGGMNPCFTSKGKVWNSLGALKNHLNLAIASTSGYWNPKHIGLRSEFRKYGECELVTFEIVHNESAGPFNLFDYLNDKIVADKEKALSNFNGNPNHYQKAFPVMVTYPDGTKEILDPLDSINDNSPNN